MSRGFSKVTLVGNLTRDPELRQTPGGTSVAQLGVAVNKSEKKNGEWVDRGHFFDVIVWGRQAETVCEYLAKGDQVSIEGDLDQRSWEAQDGTKRSKVEITCRSIVFPQRRDGNQRPAPAAAAAAAATPGPDPADFKDIDFGDEDDIPF